MSIVTVLCNIKDIISRIRSMKNGENTIITHRSTKDDNDNNYNHENEKINKIV